MTSPLIKGCMGKVRHKTADKALKAALKAMEERGTPLRVYYCALCNGGWHLTSRPGKGAPDVDAEILQYQAELEKQKQETERLKLARADRLAQRTEAHRDAVKAQRAVKKVVRSDTVHWMRERMREACACISRDEVGMASAILNAVVSMPTSYLNNPDAEPAVAFMEARIRDRMTWWEAGRPVREKAEEVGT